MVAALQLTAFANVIIGFIVIGLARRGAVSPEAPIPSPTAVAGSVPAPTKGVPRSWMGLLVFLTGGVSMEIADLEHPGCGIGRRSGRVCVYANDRITRSVRGVCAGFVGGGITAGALLGHPLQRITVTENCRPVIEAAQLFDPWNRGVLTNARVRLWEEDARTILKLNSETYDLIISEPSNPWTAGIGSVFSRDFYELAARRLKPDGMMVQWFHIYEINDEIVRMVLRTFGSVFPYLEIWDAQPGDIILLGAQSPWPSTPEIYRRSFEREGPREDLRRIGLHSPEAVWARQLASQRTAHAIAGSGPEQSDAFPVLEYEAPRAFFIGASALQLLQYDERTWQSALATPARRQASSRLSVTDLRTAFGSYGSVNAELNQYLAFRFQNEAGEGQNQTRYPLRTMPSLFRPADSRVELPEPPPGLNEKLTRLWRSEIQLAAKTAPWQSGVDEIFAVLTELAAADGLVDPSLRVYASVAIRACFAHDDLDRARRLVSLGRQLAPDHAAFGYYARILERESRRP